MTPENGWSLFLFLCAVDDVLETIFTIMLIVCTVSCVAYLVTNFIENRKRRKQVKEMMMRYIKPKVSKGIDDAIMYGTETDSESKAIPKELKAIIMKDVK